MTEAWGRSDDWSVRGTQRLRGLELGLGVVGRARGRGRGMG